MRELPVKKRTSILFLLFILFFIIILDFGFGWLFIPRSYSFFRTLHPVYHHGLMPNQKGLAAWGPLVYPFYTNSLGFRDASSREIDLKSDKKRILMLGDSHTEAVGVNFEDSFSGILSVKAMDRNIELLNGAVVSYSPKIYYYKVKDLLENVHLSFNELWVFLDLSDLQNELAYEAFSPKKETGLWKLTNSFKKFMMAHSFIYSTISSGIDKKRIGDFSATMKSFGEKSQRYKPDNILELYSTFFKDFTDKELIRSPSFHGVGKWYYDSTTIKLAEKGINLGKQNMKLLSDLCRQNNILLRISVHPWQVQVSKQDTLDFYVRNWKDFCAKEGIDFINLFPLFINGENPEIANKKYYIPNDNHWSETGHEKVAFYLEKYLY